MFFKKELVRPNKEISKPKLFYPEAQFIPHLPHMPTMGEYKKKFPEGVVIHYTAGDIGQSGESAVKQAIENGYSYFFIDRWGYVYQQFDLHRWGYHAGISQCPITKRTSVSRHYVGIEIACSGLLSDSKTWFGKRVAPVNVRKADHRYLVSGEFEKFENVQERALIELCLWLCQKGANPDYIFGHQEVSPGRKSDPGASLSMPMKDFRETIKKDFEVWKSSQLS